ncbi:MAG: cation:proton antiporter [Phycisphaerae bacterium]|nr:cation:proton antiporter [Phycisphaerae bacterium]
MELLAANTGATEGLNLVLLFGLIILMGTFGSRFFQRLHIPQVVGCIVVGIILGDVLGLITPHSLEKLEPFTMFALGLIGFMIGGELRADVFKKYGRQFFVILFSQGLGAFLLVSVGTAFVANFLFDTRVAIAMGLVFGAIASATAPDATVNVLWEYKTRGSLTTAILAIVAALALLLYRAAATGAKALVGTRGDSVLSTTLVLLGEIIGAILLGFLAGVILFLLLKFVIADDKILDFAVASLLLVVGVSMIPGIDPILPAMTMGITMANLAPRQSKTLFSLVGQFTLPIYIAFFVLAGAHMEFGKISYWLIAMIAVYTLMRAAGKMAGAWYGAKLSAAPAAVRKYLGICLLPQAGVAIGLAILAGQQFDERIGPMIVMVVMTGTFLMEVLGPMLVKVGVKKAGEIGLNITEDDLIRMYTVKDVMEQKPPIITQDLPLHDILEIFSSSDSVYCPVIDSKNNIAGKITIAGIKEMFANQDVAGWLLPMDVAEPVDDVLTSDMPLRQAFEMMRRYDLEDLPVVKSRDELKLLGVLNVRMVNRRISAEVLNRRKTAADLALAF